jgi:flagellar motor switch protein FliN
MSIEGSIQIPAAQPEPGDPNAPGAGMGLDTSRSAAEAAGGHRSDTMPGGAMMASAAFPHTLDFLLDVRISVSVEVGRVQMPVRQVMELGPGAVIELQRSASEPVEVHANGKCIGRGEIVVVGEQFGVRITEIGPA